MSLELIFKLGISSSDAVRLYPELDYEEGKVKIKNEHKTRSGKAWNYTWSNYKKFDIPVEYVSGNNASLINSWWLSDTQLLFFKTIQITTEGIEDEYLELVDSGALELVGGGFLELVDEADTVTTSTEVHSVYIINKRTPLRQFNKPYNKYWRGSIELESY